MNQSKQRTEQHIIDEEGKILLEKTLPRSWVLREYRQDYGIDFELEVFRRSRSDKNGKKNFETLGERIFIQLKTTTKPKRKTLTLYPRYNVEKYPEKLRQEEPATKIETLQYSLETSELVTVQRMGAAVPVLLVLADLSEKRCYFVCLNDYIDKILVPRYGDYWRTASRTIHIPIQNLLSGAATGRVALRWYAKRAKLYAAFQKFVYQQAELSYASDTQELKRLAGYFASKISKYDFWDDTEMWRPIPSYGKAIQRFLKAGSPGLLKRARGIPKSAKEKKGIEKLRELQDIRVLWSELTVMPRTYEDVCREWLLPTQLGTLLSTRNF